MLPEGNTRSVAAIYQLLSSEINEKALEGHPEGFLGGLTSLSVDRVKSSKD
jgi:hypothetical protein